MNVAVILAGGVGSRMGSDKPKQFFKVAGKTVLEHTVDAFEQHKLIDEIVIVSNANYVSEVENLVLNNEWKKVRKVIRGGKERYESSVSAIQAYQEEKPNLIFHDAVRPLLSQRIISEVIEALNIYTAIDVAIPAVDTIIEVKNGFIEKIPNRSNLLRGQTPQAFHYATIKSAYELALNDPHFSTTDDCGVVNKYLPNQKVFVIKGEEANMKITYKEDTFLLDKLFQLKTMDNVYIASSMDKLKDKVGVIFGASSGIGECLMVQCKLYGAKIHGLSRSIGGVDIAERNQVKEALLAVYKEHGKIDFIVNTAGVLYKEPLISMDDKKIETIINTNYLGMVNVALESFPYLKETEGHLLFFTSSSYTLGRAFYSLYSSTKAAAVNFVQAIAQEWDHNHIKVNCINPERTKTRMRIENFGIEPEESLLNPEQVALVCIKTILADYTGQVIDIKKAN
jgi:2-C-methyl-D-erythritol 4-phosphate cytidylyltransferase